MIKFACTCSKVLNVTDDQAGTSMQCPFCGKLVDVPLLSDLDNLTAEGTYKVGPEEHREEANRLAELHRVFRQQRVDEHGNEIDLRPTHDTFAHIGEEPAEDEILGFADEHEPHKTPGPKYDPITGELVRPIEIKDDRPRVDPNTIPIAKAVINYATPGQDVGFSGARIIPEMFKFQNLTVLFAVFVAHIFLIIVTFPMMAGIFIVAPGYFVMKMLILSHYAIVVEDIAVEGNDELPRPLRDLSWVDDLWGPFKQFMIALFLCYGLIVLADYLPPLAQIPMKLAVLGFGTVLFPAVFLTMTTSGSIINLSPDRILRVMSETGIGAYTLCVILWGVSLASYTAGILASFLAIYKLFFMPGALPGWMNVPMWIGYPMLVLGMFVMHGFCWYLALQYRRHHEAFGWAFQKHIRTLPNPPPALVRNRKPHATPPAPPPPGAAPARAAKVIPPR